MGSPCLRKRRVRNVGLGGSVRGKESKRKATGHSRPQHSAPTEGGLTVPTTALAFLSCLQVGEFHSLDAAHPHLGAVLIASGGESCAGLTFLGHLDQYELPAAASGAQNGQLGQRGQARPGLGVPDQSTGRADGRRYAPMSAPSADPRVKEAGSTHGSSHVPRAQQTQDSRPQAAAGSAALASASAAAAAAAAAAAGAATAGPAASAFAAAVAAATAATPAVAAAVARWQWRQPMSRVASEREPRAACAWACRHRRRRAARWVLSPSA